MANLKESFPVPRNLDEAKELIDKLGIEDLRTFCLTFGLSQEETKANLKERLMRYYQDLFSLENGTPVPMPRKRSVFTSPPGTPPNELELPEAGGFEVKENTSDAHVSSPIVEHLRQADDRIDRIEDSVKKMNTYVEESLATFRVSLAEALMESTEKMMRSLREPVDHWKKEKEQERSGNFSASSVRRKLNFLSKNAKGVCEELQKSIDSEAIPSRVERQFKRLNDYESDCVRSIEELLANVEQED